MSDTYSFSICMAPLLAFATTLALIRWMLKSGTAAIAMDKPCQRSLHTAAMPRSGGLAIMAGVLAGWSIMLPPSWLWPVLLTGTVLAAISFWDDTVSLPIGWRLLAHFAGAGALVVFSFPGAGAVELAVMLIAIAWMANLYNFMDGSDGLAGGMALIGFGFYGTAAWAGGDAALAQICWAIALAAAAFLIFNFHPARIFMGDSGSVPLGFFAAALGLVGWNRGIWPAWLPLLVFSPFIVDATATLLKRIAKMERPWRAHKDHYYQRLVRMGYGHRKTALLEYALMVATGISAVWGTGLNAQYQWLLLGGWSLIYLMIILAVDIKWRKFSLQQPNGD